jgi:hypothetical protein
MRVSDAFNHLRSRLTGSAKIRKSKPSPGRRKFAFEPLEDRLLLSAVLYVDYGDAFAGGVLNTTVGAIDNTTSGSNPNIDGPRLTDSAGKNYTDATTVAITSFNTVYGTNTTERDGDRAAIDALVKRFYAPLDIQVVDLTTTAQTVPGTTANVQAAASLNDVSNTLGQLGSHDSYVFVGLFAIGATNDNPANFASNGYGGLATGTDIGGNNNNDGTALVLMRNFANKYSEQFLGDQVAHESGHLFGLAHTFGNNPSSSPGIDSGLLQSDMMSYLAYTTFGGFDVFSRYPMVKGDGNTSNDTLAAGSGAPTEFDQMRADPNIGPSNMEYVTGTGQNDIITITKSGATTGSVSVQAFTGADYTGPIEVPGTATSGSVYTYTIDLTKPLLIDAGARDDRIVLDGDLGNTITVRGMAGNDEVVVMGKNAATGRYVPGTNTANGLDGNSDLRGSIVIGATTINFQEFDTTSKVTVRDIGSFTFRTPLPTDSLTLESVAAGQSRVTGTSGGINIVPMTFFNVTGMTIDTGTNDGGGGSDTLTVASTGILAAGLTNLTYDAGTGNDLLILNQGSYTLPGGGAFTYLGGSGSDEVRATADVNFTLSDTSLGNSAGGSIVLTSIENALLTGGAGVNTFNVSNWNGSATLRGTSNDDHYNIDFVGGGSGSVVVQDSSGTADTVNVNGTANADTLLVAAGSVSTSTEVVSFSGIEILTVDAKGGDDVVTVNGTGPVTTVLGGAGNDDFFVNATGPSGITLDGQGGSDDYTVNFGSLAGIVNVSDTPAANVFDRLFVNGTSTADTLVIAPLFVQRNGTERVSYSGIEELIVDAGDGNDDITVNGTSVPTTVKGNAGDDSFTVNGVMNAPLTLDGGAGTDSLLLNGTSGDDVIILTDTSISGLGAGITLISIENLVIDAGAGNDLVDGSALTLSVTIFGGTGDDTLLGGSNDDKLYGQDGNDRLHGNNGNDLLDGGDGNDALFGDDGNDDLEGGNGDDHLYAGAGDDLLNGNAGADIAYGGGGQDQLIADQSGDQLIDWFGNFNDFDVPGHGSGAPIIIRSPNPKERDYLINLAIADGSTDPEVELSIVIPGSADQQANSGNS